MDNAGGNFLHAVRFLLGIDRAETQTSEKERAMLRRYAEGRTRAVEIGVYEGVNTRNIAEVMDPKGVLYGVDPFPKGR